MLEHRFFNKLLGREPFERGADVLYSACRSRRQSRRNIGSVIKKVGREIRLTDAQVFPVHELLKMIADEFLHLRMRHSSLGILDFRTFRCCVHPGSPFQADAA